MSQLPQGPTTPPFWQLLNWIFDPFDFLERCARRYGDLFTIRLGGFRPLVFVAHPQGVQEIFAVDAKLFDAGRGNVIVRPLVGENSLLVLDGEHHRRDRKLLMPPFHGESLRRYAQQICQIAQQEAQWQLGQTINMRRAMQSITLEVILQVVFGIREGERYQQLKPLTADLLEQVASPIRSSLLFIPFLQQNWGPWAQFTQLLECIRTLLQAEIDERRPQSPTDTPSKDILALMMAARTESGVALSDRELQDELLTLLLAGHETTATALSWAFYWVCQCPQVQEKLLAELASLGDRPEPMAIYQLPYLTAVCEETLRLYPVVPITSPRIAKTPVTVMGRQFGAETSFAPCIYLIHHREDLYPHSHQFRPERFLERQYSPYEFLPFGGGNRRCLGAALAMLELKLVLATLLSSYQFQLTASQPIKPVRRGVTLAPHNGVPLRLIGRRQLSQPIATPY
ncbi:MAG: cytochrome P450 [Chloroflexaceae bacterium]|nr:cytochrome P450 [Chloroflexaceae bacterium]